MNKDPAKTTQSTSRNSEPLTEHVQENRAHWDNIAASWVSAGERSWDQESPTWGIWALAESELQLLPSDMKNMKAIELGCGTAYVSAWMVRLGAQVVGIDNSKVQLATAERLTASLLISFMAMQNRFRIRMQHLILRSVNMARRDGVIREFGFLKPIDCLSPVVALHFLGPILWRC